VPAGDRAAIAELPSIAPAQPLPTYQEPPGAAPALTDDAEEPALPDEARERVAVESRAATVPVESGRASVLHVTFRAGPAGQLVEAMQAFRQLLRERPGDTGVIVHVPGPGGASLPMPLSTTVAYDADLVAEIARRLGDGTAQVQLEPGGAAA
jgi:hypothetical protein